MNNSSGPLIIALGNPLRGDDGVAWHVAEALTVHALPPGTKVLTTHQLLPEMADDISHATQVIFVDASMQHLPGEVSISRVVDATPDVHRGTHELDPPGVLALADRLFGLAPPATLVAIGGQAFDHSESLSSAVQSAVPTAVSRILILLA
jgi:hydrogenase maturation protease